MKRESEKRPSLRANSAEKPELLFAEADLQAIAQELGVACTPELKNQLITSARNYFSLKDFWANKENTAEVKADLIKVGKQARKLVKSLEKLGPVGQEALRIEFPELESMIGAIRQLAEAAENEVQHLTFGKGGPTKNAPLIMILESLATTIYYKHTGKTPGISTDPYKESFGGPFFRFAIAWLKAVEPDLVASEKDEQKIGKLVKNHLDLIKSQIQSHPK